MSTAITTFGTSTSEWLLLISHGMRLTGHQEPHFVIASQEHAVVCSVLVEAWAPTVVRILYHTLNGVL
jgi:hypothetical protein